MSLKTVMKCWTAGSIVLNKLNEIDESNKKRKEDRKIMDMAFESHKTIIKQEEAMNNLNLL